ncbi:sulfate reduction electron transfer complex DsrMKJOP subunit DsrJ [Desulfovibrio litoralis]|uniref:Putative sulfite reductase-associated electron transfer protein DsrJ n=1 Tax=Desulfovibrio litoralis DSM 11393 TaxID=1121455 RepID=A0A1M7RZI5_9BACT|nr:sulfate reduction electron transfer complex DsrMKJOP subunit DsrJ [Desulfovibrio litoralis]SHN51739.1 putative sulfite reductase-associated electron transfer protein DsrJ [Desulfovibrio litoralis DSM 11393]
MYNKNYIIAGLVIFVVLALAPIIFNIASEKYRTPELALPNRNVQPLGINETVRAEYLKANPEADKNPACILPAADMRSEHMQMLNTWRDMALREGKRAYTAKDGRIWEVSLQNTCMKCHGNKADFCDKCHTTNSVTPYCWDCHVEPRGN